MIAIEDNVVRVKETYVDFLGQETTKDIELRHASEPRGVSSMLGVHSRAPGWRRSVDRARERLRSVVIACAASTLSPEAPVEETILTCTWSKEEC